MDKTARRNDVGDDDGRQRPQAPTVSNASTAAKCGHRRRHRQSNPPRHTVFDARRNDHRHPRHPHAAMPVTLFSSDEKQQHSGANAAVVVGVCPGDHLLQTRATGPQVTLCAHFAANGECSRGRKCRFAHYVGPPASMGAEKSSSAEVPPPLPPPKPAATGRDGGGASAVPAREAAPFGPGRAGVVVPAGAKAVVAAPGGGWQHAAYAARPLVRSPAATHDLH
jgi:hypothetical protein